MFLHDDNLYYVGGIVRDEILGISSFDTDYCYEGDAISFAKEKGLNIIKENSAFGTVRVLYEGKEIDIASTRSETYPKAGHLPVVEKIGCSLEEDLKRRDFTINAMAKRTTDGKIVDLFNGMDDIKNKKLRVLHRNSFVDDPTRIVRALKFSVRFGFDLEDETKQLMDDYLTNVNYDMSFHRLRKELVETFNLNRQEAFDKFIEEKIYKLLGKNVFAPVLKIKIEDFDAINEIKPTWLVYLSFFDLENIELTRAERRILEWAKRLNSELPNNNTPKASVVLNNLWRECGYVG